jgi:hypothetical protein
MALLPSRGPELCQRSLLLLAAGVAVLLASSMVQQCAATLDEDIELIWGASHTYFFMDGPDTESLALSLDEQQGSCFRSRDSYLYATISMDIKLVEGNSAGVVGTIYVRFRGLVASPIPCKLQIEPWIDLHRSRSA